MEAPDFWNDPEVSQNKMKEVKSLKDDVATYAALSAQYDDKEVMIVMGYEENDPELIPEIDEKINEIAEGWRTRRMGKVELTILRLAVFEMKYDEEIPEKVAINEAVELAKKFGGDEAPAFVNGILAKLIQKGN